MDAVLSGKIAKALDEVRPYMQSHGGDITVVDLKENRLYVKFQGACVGCPISLYTLKMGVEERVKKYVPEIVEVVSIDEECI